jgi:hypothetical protein
LARWHVALDICDSLQQFGRAEASVFLQQIAQVVVPAFCEDDCLLLRLHEQLSVAVEGRATPASIELAGWLSLLEHRLTRPDRQLAFALVPSSHQH